MNISSSNIAARHRANSAKYKPQSRVDGMRVVMGVNGNMCLAKADESQRDWASPVTVYDTGVAGNGCNDSDRLLTADWGKHNQLCRKHFGDEAQIWGGALT